MIADNLTRHSGKVARSDRETLLRQRGTVVWLTGLSGSGKSTLAYALEERLVGMGHLAYVLDGDNVRHGLNANLGFSPEDRDENIRRVGEAAALFADAGLIAIAAFISPYREGRQHARRCATGAFVEVYLSADISVCEKRDPKGLYQKARAGKIADFTGISAPYHVPQAPDVELDTGALSPGECIDELVAFLREQGRLRSPLAG